MGEGMVGLQARAHHCDAHFDWIGHACQPFGSFFCTTKNERKDKRKENGAGGKGIVQGVMACMFKNLPPERQ